MPLWNPATPHRTPFHTPVPASIFSHLDPASHSSSRLHPCLPMLHSLYRSQSAPLQMEFRSYDSSVEVFQGVPTLSGMKCKLCTTAYRLDLSRFISRSPSLRSSSPAPLAFLFLEFANCFSPLGICTCFSLSLECSFPRTSPPWPILSTYILIKYYFPRETFSDSHI